MPAERTSGVPSWRTAVVPTGAGLGLSLLIGWVFSVVNGAGADAAHASAAEGYGFRERAGSGERPAGDS